MELLLTLANAKKDLMDDTVKTTSMIANMRAAKTKECVKMESLLILVNATLDMKENFAKVLFFSLDCSITTLIFKDFF